jgi:hypothetical protein
MSNHSSGSLAKRVSANVAPQILQTILATPEKAKPEKIELTLRELVAELYDGIVEMKVKGYASEDICELLEQNGSPAIAPATLNRYISQETRKRTKLAKELKRKRKSSGSSSSPNPEMAIDLKRQTSKSPERSNVSSDILQDETILLEERQIETEELPFDIEKHLEEISADEEHSSDEAEAAKSIEQSKSFNKKTRFNNLLLDKKNL